jgi:hypothetical protein
MQTEAGRHCLIKKRKDMAYRSGNPAALAAILVIEGELVLTHRVS